MKFSSLETLDRALRNLFKAGFALSEDWTRWLLEICHNLKYSFAVRKIKRNKYFDCCEDNADSFDFLC